MNFDQTLGQFGDSIALILDDGEEVSYRQLEGACGELEYHLAQYDTKQLVLIGANNDVSTIVGYLAALRTNHAVMMVNLSLDDDLMRALLEAYHPTLIWKAASDGTYALNASGSIRSTPIHPELALLLSTSGSTGSPKLVRLSRKNLYANCASIVEYLELGPTERAITSLPLSYSYGLSLLNTHLAVGASITVTNLSLMQREFWNVMDRFAITSFSGVPYHYEMLDRLCFFQKDLPHLRCLTQAGGRLDSPLVTKFSSWAANKGIRFFVMYGQTEATARISYLDPAMVAEKPSSIGKAITGGQLSLLEGGELVYEGPNVMMGYATSAADLSRGDELHGTLHTGDLAWRDEDGLFYIVGRLSRFLKIHGNRIGLDEVEAFLRAGGHPALCAGEDDKLLIVTRDAAREAELRLLVCKKFGFHHSVVKVRTVEEFPTTESGKICYEKLNELL